MCWKQSENCLKGFFTYDGYQCCHHIHLHPENHQTFVFFRSSSCGAEQAQWSSVVLYGSMNSEKAAVVLRSLISIHHGDVIQVPQSVNKICTFSLTQMWGWEKPLFAHIINLTWNTADAMFFQMAVPQVSTILFNTAYSSHFIYPIALVWLTLHLDQKLCLDAAGSLAFILVPRAAQRIHLVDEDDWRFVLAS